MARSKKKISGIILAFLTAFIFFLIISLIFLFQRKSGNAPTFLYKLDYNPSCDVVIKSIVPVSDVIGKEFDGSGTKDGVQGYTEITIENLDKKTHDYTILVINKEANLNIDGRYIKFYLTDIDDVPIDGYEGDLLPSYEKLALYKNTDKHLLATVRVPAQDKKIIKVRAWLADNYVISLYEEQFKYSISVVEEY